MCRNPSCLNPDHHHPEPSDAQRRFFAESWPDLALWCCDMASRVLQAGDRHKAGTLVMTALSAAVRGDRTDPELIQLVSETNPAAGDLLRDRYVEAQSGLDCIVSSRAARAAEVEARLEIAGIGLMRLERAA